MLILPIFGSSYVYADDFGRSEGKGYFYNKSGSGKFDDDYNVIKKGIDKSDIKNAKAFYDFIRGRYKSGSEQDKTGAAFIVNTMVGNKAPGYGKSISDSEWDDFRERIENIFENGEVKWTSYTICGKTSSYYQKKNKDDAFYDLDKDDVVDAMGKKKASSYCKPKVAEFKYNGDTLYRIAEDCANPVGNLSSKGLPKPKKWTISAISSVNMATAAPGQRLSWTHKLYNDGPDKTTKTIHSSLAITGFSNDWNGTRADGYTSSGKDKGIIRTIVDYATYDVGQVDVDNTLCEMVHFQPKSWLSGSSGDGNNSCVFIPYKYSLDPKIGDIKDIVEPDTITTIPTVVTNSGPTKSKNTSWDITQVIVQPGGIKPNEMGGNSINPACGNYFRPAPSDGNCKIIASGNNKVFNSTGARPDGKPLSALPDSSLSGDGEIGDLSVGTKVCYAISVKDRSDSSNEWRHSPLSCMTVGKKPKVQILGGDLLSGGLIQTSISKKNISGTTRMFGSWDEYAALAVGSISRMGSGAAFAGPGMIPTVDFNKTVCNYSKLSFLNSGKSIDCEENLGAEGWIGGYAITQSMPDVESSFPGGETIYVDTISPDDLLSSDGTYVGNYTGNLTLTQSELAPGKSIILKVNGTVTIAGSPANPGNQTYSPDNDGDRYTNISQLPQLVIIANDINITHVVTNIDAWLIASGSINTCSTYNNGNVLPKSASLDSNICASKLTINGPVMTNHLYLRRTAGSDTGDQSGNPAEVFNLRADAYLWSMARARSNGYVQTVDTIELPPRF